MISIICTFIVCVTVLACVFLLTQTLIRIHTPEQQPTITEDELDKAYKDNEKIPDFQEVISFINKEFSGIETEADNE